MTPSPEAAPKAHSPPVSSDSSTRRSSRRSPQKAAAPLASAPRSTRSSTGVTAGASKPPSQHQSAPATPVSKTKVSEPPARRRKPLFVTSLTFPETAPPPPPVLKEEPELQRSQRKSKVDALNKLDRAGTPTVSVAPTATSFVPPPPPPAGPSVLRNPLKKPKAINPIFDIDSVRTSAPDQGPTANSNEARVFNLPTCPAYRPSAEEFRDPMAYIESITPEAKQYGICKIIPPEGWQMPFTLETELFRFRTRLQRLNSIEAASRAKINFLEQLGMFHLQQGDHSAHIPVIDRKLLDLWRLRKEVNKLGGIDEVNRLKAWPTITELLGYEKSSTSQVKAAYTRLVLPFENFALRAKLHMPESPHSAAGSAHSAKGRAHPPNPSADHSPSTPTAPNSRRSGMRTSPRSRMAAIQAAGNAAAPLTAMSLTPNAAPAELSEVPVANGGNLAPAPTIRLKVPGFQTSSNGSDSELSEADSSYLTSQSSQSSTQSSTPEQPSKYEKGEVCEICMLGNHAAKILLCDGCDRGFHTYCLDPPLPGVPANEEWFCTACLLGTGDDYGFDEGEDHSLSSFQARNDAFTQAWFNRYSPTYSTPGPWTRKIGNATVSETDVEREFWRLVESHDDTVEIEYGADVHSTTHGSAAPTLETHPTNAYAQDPWNLNNMAILRDSLLRYIKSDISGMTVPWIYVGMLFSTFCWHNEDHYTYSVNYMFWGETKTWYGIPGDHAEKFEDAIRREAPDLFEQQPSLLYQLVTMMNPGRLREEGVDVYACDQRPNEFVITFPKAYHCGFNHGLNFNEAVNFALPDWLPSGNESVTRYKLHAKAPVFSHQELLITITLYSDTIRTAIWLQDALRTMVDAETASRQSLRNAVPQLNESLVEEDVPEEQYQCCLCKGFCYLSQITCTCTKLVSCLDHHESLCSCPWSNRTMRKRYSDNQLQDIVDVVAERAAQPALWKARLDNALDVPRPLLKSVRQLIAEGERIPYPMPELNDLKAFNERASVWMERATAISTRKTVGRRRKGRQSEPTQSIDDDEVDRSPAAIRALLEEAEKLAFDAPEIAQLHQMIHGIESFRKEAADILSKPDSELDYQQCKTALILGESLNIELPETVDLSKVVSRLRWYHKVEEEVDDRTLQYSDIVKLLNEAEAFGIPHDHSSVIELRRREEKGRLWRDAVNRVLSQKSILLEDITGLIEGQEYTPTSIETMRQLESIRKTALSWQATASNLLTTQGSAASAQRLCKAVRTAHGPLGRVFVPELTKLQSELEFNMSWLEEVGAFLQVPTNKVNASLTTLLRELEDHLKEDDDSPNTVYSCFCREAPAVNMVVCQSCNGSYHPKCVGLNIKSTSAVQQASLTFRCQMCEHLQYDDRPSLNVLAALTDSVKWNFVLVPPEYKALDEAMSLAVRYATLLIPVIDPYNASRYTKDAELISHLLRKIWTLPVVIDAVNRNTNELVVFEEWLYKRLREALAPTTAVTNKAPRTRARKPKFSLLGNEPKQFSCLCTVPPLDHLLQVQCSKCEQGFHLSCVRAPLSVLKQDARGGWKCPFCCIKDGKAPKALDLRIQMSNQIQTDYFVDWRQTIFTYAEDPIITRLPHNPEAVVLVCDKFTPPCLPEGFERPVWVDPEEAAAERRNKRPKTGAAAKNANGIANAGSSTPPTVVPAAPASASSTPSLTAVVDSGSVDQVAGVNGAPPNLPAQNVRSNGRWHYPSHSQVPWNNTDMFSQFQVLGPSASPHSSHSAISPPVVPSTLSRSPPTFNGPIPSTLPPVPIRSSAPPPFPVPTSGLASLPSEANGPSTALPAPEASPPMVGPLMSIPAKRPLSDVVTDAHSGPVTLAPAVRSPILYSQQTSLDLPGLAEYSPAQPPVRTP